MPIELASVTGDVLTRKEYCLGFVFSRDKRKIALMRKKRPEWQRGLLNGFGGGIGENEVPSDAMRREGYEEAGRCFDWEYAGVIAGGFWMVHVFKTFTDRIEELPTVDLDHGDERILILPIEMICYRECISNLRYLIPLCLDSKIQFFIEDNWEPESDKVGAGFVATSTR